MDGVYEAEGHAATMTLQNKDTPQRQKTIIINLDHGESIQLCMDQIMDNYSFMYVLRGIDIL